MQFSSPTHKYGLGNSPRAPSTPVHQSRSPSEPAGRGADYNRSYFENGQLKSTNSLKPTTSGAAPGATAGTPAGDIFADILGQQGYNFANKPPNEQRSINAMRKEEMVRDMDPDKLKLLEWVSYIFQFCF